MNQTHQRRSTTSILAVKKDPNRYTLDLVIKLALKTVVGQKSTAL
jgi:hypothetical protein